MHCRGKNEGCGERCPECRNFAKVCDGHPDWEMHQGQWLHRDHALEDDMSTEMLARVSERTPNE